MRYLQSFYLGCIAQARLACPARASAVSSSRMWTSKGRTTGHGLSSQGTFSVVYLGFFDSPARRGRDEVGGRPQRGLFMCVYIYIYIYTYREREIYIYIVSLVVSSSLLSLLLLVVVVVVVVVVLSVLYIYIYITYIQARRQSSGSHRTGVRTRRPAGLGWLKIIISN